MRIADLFPRKGILGIVRKKLRQNKQRVQRSPELVRHVGEEIRLVATRLLEFLSLQLDNLVSAFQVVALDFELPRLLLELRVRLLEFRLLLFESGLRFLQGPTLLLELLVGDPELFALRLQFLGLPLGFRKKVLKLDAIVGGSNGHANRIRHLFEQGQSGRIERMDEAELDHRVGGPVRVRGRND